MIYDLTCPNVEHTNEKIPLVGIETSNITTYVFGCGHKITATDLDKNKIAIISQGLKEFENKSLDEIYKEMALLDLGDERGLKDVNLIEYGKKMFQKIQPKVKNILCDEFKFCEKLQYIQVIMPQASGIAIAYELSNFLEGLDIRYAILVSSYLFHIPLIKIKKWCKC